eukprot:GDKK01002681.1.p1 GENE.GDKK01002681.1~~GDKK01002681.1.p1  ORF type:complete len:787 (+),score=208.18 GDKK01002681.1:219-2363(+)
MIAESTETPTFKNTIVALELAGEDLDRAQNVFQNICLTDSNDELMALEEKLSPIFSAHSDDIYLNSALFQRVDAIFQHRTELDLTPEEIRLVEVIHKRFVRAGALLCEEKKTILRELNEEHAALTCRFRNNLLVGVVFDSKEELEGLSESALQVAAEEAKKRGLTTDDARPRFYLPLQNTSRQTQLADLTRSETRERLWRVSMNRNMTGSTSNLKIVNRLIRIRAEKAHLFGFPTWGAYALDVEMAKTPLRAKELLGGLVAPLKRNLSEEAKVLEAEQDQQEGVKPWDWEFLARKVRARRFSLDTDELKEFMELQHVLEHGVFKTMNRLFGISFVEIPAGSVDPEVGEIPAYHEDVKVYKVLDAEERGGNPVALFYTDYFARGGKRGGAWMSNFVNQSKLHCVDRRPVVVNVMNIPKPPAGYPALVTLDEVSTLFHELGHGLHGMLSNCSYPSLSGTNTSTDFVEYPSTVHEDWSTHEEVVKLYGKHHQTGASLDMATVHKIKEASAFNQGFETFEYVAAALIDLEWHDVAVPLAQGATKEQIDKYLFLVEAANKAEEETATADAPPADKSEGHKKQEALESRVLPSHDYGVHEFERRVLEKFDLLELSEKFCPPRYRSQFFSHSMNESYASKYYAYMWSETLAADSFAFFNEGVSGGPDNRRVGELFRKEVLETGNSRELMDSFVAFRGREPTVEGLLKRRGLKVDVQREQVV